MGLASGCWAVLEWKQLPRADLKELLLRMVTISMFSAVPSGPGGIYRETQSKVSSRRARRWRTALIMGESAGYWRGATVFDLRAGIIRRRTALIADLIGSAVTVSCGPQESGARMGQIVVEA